MAYTTIEYLVVAGGGAGGTPACRVSKAGGKGVVIVRYKFQQVIMAHFAKLGINGKVIAVHAVNNSDILNGNNQEDEKVGQQFLERIHGWPGPMWIQTSYNTSAGVHTLGGTPLRGNYAGIGKIYDEDNRDQVK